jgi:hypothetical protein
MQWIWGNYAHVANEVDLLSLTQTSQMNEGGQVMVNRVQYSIKGFIQAADQNSLNTAMFALQNVYANPIQENRVYQAQLLMNDGSGSIHYIGGPGSRNGVVCTNFAWMKEDGGEFSTYRSYQLTLEAEYDVLNVELAAFHESLTLIGTGGPKITDIECLTFPAQRQITQAYTLCRAVQTGIVVGHTRFVSPPGPLWPGNELQHLRESKPSSPKRSGPVGYPVYTKFEWAYTYHFSSPVPFQGFPNIWQ